MARKTAIILANGGKLRQTARKWAYFLAAVRVSMLPAK